MAELEPTLGGGFYPCPLWAKTVIPPLSALPIADIGAQPIFQLRKLAKAEMPKSTYRANNGRTRTNGQ